MTEKPFTNEDRLLFHKIAADIKNNPDKYRAAGQWLDVYTDKENVWHAIEARCKGILDRSLKREDRQESTSLIVPDSVLEICKILQAVAVVDMDFLPDLEVLMSRYENEAKLIPDNFKSVYERIDTRAKIEQFLDKLFPNYRQHQTGLICDYYGLYVACEDLIEKHDKIKALDKADNLKVCLLTWLICCPDLGASELNITEFEKVPWSLSVGTDSNPHRAKVLQILATSELLSKGQTLACKASKDVDGAESQPAGGGGVIVAIIVAIVLVLGFEYCIYFLKWKWLLNHPNKLSLEIGSDIMLTLASLALFVPKRYKMYWFGGVCAVALVLLGLLGK